MIRKTYILVVILIVVLVVASCAAKDKTPGQPVPQDNSINQPEAVGKQEEQAGKGGDNTLGSLEDKNADYGVYPGDKAYGFELKDLEGNVVNLSDYKGKVVIVTFWRTDCSWCRKELPLFDKLYKAYKDGDLVVLAVNVGEAKKKVSQVVKDEGFTFPVLLDEQAEVAKKYLISGLPTSFIINRNEIISATHIGYMDYSQMEHYVETAFKER